MLSTRRLTSDAGPLGQDGDGALRGPLLVPYWVDLGPPGVWTDSGELTPTGSRKFP